MDIALLLEDEGFQVLEASNADADRDRQAKDTDASNSAIAPAHLGARRDHYRFAGALGAIEKPYTMNGMKNALTYISAIVGGDESGSPPASLVLAVG